jgi:hypothetical protein
VEEYFFQLFNVHNVSDVMQIEVHTAEPLVPGPSRLEVEIAIAIPEELIQAGGEMLLSAIHKLIHSIWNKEELPDQWKKVYYCTNSQKG